jgi:hypothetical protein
MDELIASLVPAKHQAHAQGLLDDPGSRHLIRQQLSQLAEDNAGVLPQKSMDWVLCKLSTFGADEEDTFRMYRAFLSQVSQLGQMCRVLSTEINRCRQDPPATVADRITIGLGLFYEEAERRHRYHAAPSPKFYQQTASTCFAVTGYQTIATQLPAWLEFLRGNFTLH